MMTSVMNNCHGKLLVQAQISSLILTHENNVAGDTLLNHVGEFLPEGVEFFAGSTLKRVKRRRGFQMP